MNRKYFLQKTSLITGANVLTGNDVFSALLAESGMDKLTDEQGNFIPGALPYSDTFLEPFMPTAVQ